MKTRELRALRRLATDVGDETELRPLRRLLTAQETLEAEAHVVRAVRVLERRERVDPAGRAELVERAVERLASVDRGLLHGVLQDVDLTALDEVFDARRVDEDLERG